MQQCLHFTLRHRWLDLIVFFGHQVDDAVRNMLQQLLRNGDDAGIGQSF